MELTYSRNSHFLVRSAKSANSLPQRGSAPPTCKITQPQQKVFQRKVRFSTFQTPCNENHPSIFVRRVNQSIFHQRDLPDDHFSTGTDALYVLHDCQPGDDFPRRIAINGLHLPGILDDKPAIQRASGVRYHVQPDLRGQ